MLRQLQTPSPLDRVGLLLCLSLQTMGSFRCSATVLKEWQRPIRANLQAISALDTADGGLHDRVKSGM